MNPTHMHSYGEIAYTTFRDAIIGEGAWDDLPPPFQHAWNAAADAAIRQADKDENIGEE